MSQFQEHLFNGYRKPLQVAVILGTLTLSLLAPLVASASTGNWTATGAMATGRCGHTATLLPNGKVLVAGNRIIGGASAELYDPTTGTWTTTGAMATGRYVPYSNAAAQRQGPGGGRDR